MGKLIAVVGPSGVGKTSLVQALSAAGDFEVAFEQHSERPFQALFKQDPRYALANQLDYLLHRAGQEHALRTDPRPGLVDGGLDLDFHGFTRLFHARGWLSDLEFDLCRRLHGLTRELMPPPDLVVHLTASAPVIRLRLAARNRINIASGQDAELLDGFLRAWLETVPLNQKIQLDVSDEDMNYSRSVERILARI
jgi:deoxyadenosine/deoxycytidine kinase